MSSKSKEIKVTLPPRIAKWYELQKRREDKTDSAFARKCIINYLGHRFGKDRILDEDP